MFEEGHVLDINRLRLEFEGEDSNVGPKIIELEKKKTSVTVSMGIAASSESTNIQEILDIADKRLYFAKENGRNKVIFN